MVPSICAPLISRCVLQFVLLCPITEVAQSCYTFGLVTRVGHPTTCIPKELFSILAQITWDIRVRLHYATGVRWIRKPSVHPFGWEVRVQVVLAEGNKSLVMGASSKTCRALHLNKWHPNFFQMCVHPASYNLFHPSLPGEGCMLGTCNNFQAAEAKECNKSQFPRAVCIFSKLFPSGV